MERTLIPPQLGSSSPTASTSTLVTEAQSNVMTDTTVVSGTINGANGDESDALSKLLLPKSNVNPSSISGTLDLISLFGLSNLYDTHLRPYLPDHLLQSSTSSGMTESNAKGKGKAKEASEPAASGSGGTKIGISFGGIKLLSNESNGGGSHPRKRQKQERNYSHLVADIPGRNTIRKDTYLKHLILNPDTPAIDLRALDNEVLEQAFTLKPGQIPGFDNLIWENDHHQGGGGGGPGSGKKNKKKKRPRESDSHNNSAGPTPTTAFHQNGLNGNNAGDGGDDHRKKKKFKT